MEHGSIADRQQLARLCGARPERQHRVSWTVRHGDQIIAAATEPAPSGDGRCTTRGTW